MPEKEVKAVAEALQARFSNALNAGRLSQVLFFSFYCPFGLKKNKNKIKYFISRYFLFVALGIFYLVFAQVGLWPMVGQF